MTPGARRRGAPTPRLRTVAVVSILGLASGYGHVLYPLWLVARTRNTEHPAPPQVEDWPAVTVLVPAYRERQVIAAKVDDVLGNGYPGPLDVVVVADDPATAAAARATRATVIEPGERLGKAEALNRGVAQVTTPVIVLTDANADMEPGSLRALVRWFADPSVLAVAGEKVVRGDAGEALYWRFESWLKRRESQAGTTIGMVGELAAVRRDACPHLPGDAVVDDMWLALDIAGAGGRVVYEPGARAVEDPSPDARAEWERRTRMTAGIIDTCWRRRELLAPSGGLVAAQLWGHRLMRSAVGPLAHALLVVLAVRRAPRSRIARLFVAAHAWGGAAVVRRHRGLPLGRLERLPAQVLWLQCVALGGIARYARRDLPARWPKPERAAPTPEGSR